MFLSKNKLKKALLIPVLGFSMLLLFRPVKAAAGGYAVLIDAFPPVPASGESGGENAILRSSGTVSPDECWNLKMIGAGDAADEGSLGKGIRVGIVDSGVNPLPEFGDRLLPGHNYDPKAQDNTDTRDSLGHGTRVAGLVAASSNGLYRGVSPEAEIVPLKVTDDDSVEIGAVCEAIYGGIDEFNCDVLNLSLGTTLEYEELNEAVKYAEKKGVIITASVGNTGSAAIYYPACIDTVIGVGSVDRNGKVSLRSNHNKSVFLTAPGVEVQTVDNGGEYYPSSGTSFSSPQAAAAAAVLLGKDEALSPGKIRSLLSLSALDKGAEGYDEYYGYGILNLSGALELLGSGAYEEEAALTEEPENKEQSEVKKEGTEEGSNSENTEEPENGGESGEDEKPETPSSEKEVKPGEPVVSNQSYGVINISWTGNGSGKYTIYRKAKGSKKWKKIKKLKTKDPYALNTYTDRRVKPDVIYSYILAFPEGSKTCSPNRYPDKYHSSEEISIRKPDTLTVKQISEIETMGKRKSVTIGYSLLSDLPKGASYVVWRRDPGKSWKKLKKIKMENAIGEYTDRRRDKGIISCEYAVQAVAGKAKGNFKDNPVTVCFKK